MFDIFKKKKSAGVLPKSEINDLKAYIDAHASEKAKGNGNGHKPEIPISEVINAKPAAKAKKAAVQKPATAPVIEDSPAPENKGAAPVAASKPVETEQEREMRLAHEEEEREQEKRIPGYGVIIGTKKKFLPEATSIDKGQALTIALGFMQEDMLDPDREESLFDLFAERIMRLQKSVDHFSLDQYLLARQQDADKNATAMTKADLIGGR